MSKLTVKACIHTINPFGFNQNEGKTEKTESRVHTRLDYAEVLRLAAALLAGYGGAQL